jgi:hypothetical protein
MNRRNFFGKLFAGGFVVGAVPQLLLGREAILPRNVTMPANVTVSIDGKKVAEAVLAGDKTRREVYKQWAGE